MCEPLPRELWVRLQEGCSQRLRRCGGDAQALRIVDRQLAHVRHRREQLANVDPLTVDSITAMKDKLRERRSCGERSQRLDARVPTVQHLQRQNASEQGRMFDA